MGTPITLSGFNNIDFNLILEAIMTQERVPLEQLQGQRQALQSQDSQYSNLVTKLASLETATEKLSDADSFGGRTVTEASVNRAF